MTGIRIELAELLAQSATPGPDCLDEATLTRLAGQELDPEARRAAEAHASSCAQCACEIELAGAFARDQPLDPAGEQLAGDIVAALRTEASGAPGVQPARPGRWSLRGLLPITASLLVATAAIVLLVGRAPAPPPVPQAGGTVARSGGVRQIAPRGSVADAPERLVWERYEHAPTFQVQLLAVDDTVLWEGTVSGDSTELPEEIRGGLAHHVAYRWSIRPLAPDGGIGPTSLSRFTIVPDTVPNR